MTDALNSPLVGPAPKLSTVVPSTAAAPGAWSNYPMSGGPAPAAPAVPVPTHAAAPAADAWSQYPMSGGGPAPAPAGPKNYQWSDVAGAALMNAPGSAYRTGEMMVSPLLHPIQTAETFADLASGLAGMAEDAMGGANRGTKEYQAAKKASEAKVNAVATFFKNRYGSMQALRNTLATDPVGVLADMSTVLTMGDTALARAPGLIGTAGRAAGTAGRFIDPLSVAGKLGGVGLKTAARFGPGLHSGVGGESFIEAAKAGRAGGSAGESFRQQMRDTAGLHIKAAYHMTKSAMGKMRAEAKANYLQKVGGIKGATKHLDWTPVDQALADAKAKIMFEGTSKDEAALATHDRLAAKVAEWKRQPSKWVPTQTGWHNYTPHQTAEGFDALKQAIGTIQQEQEVGSLSRTVSEDVYKAIHGEIVKNNKPYAEAMKEYHEAQEMMREVEREFSMKAGGHPGTAIRKLQGMMRNNVTSGQGYRKALGDVLSKYEPDLIPTLAGQSVQSWEPRNLARLTATAGLEGGAMLGLSHLDPRAVLAAIPGVLMSSPRLMGEAVHAGGRAVGAAERAGKAAARAAPTAARAVKAVARPRYQAGQITTLQQPTDVNTQ